MLLHQSWRTESRPLRFSDADGRHEDHRAEKLEPGRASGFDQHRGDCCRLDLNVGLLSDFRIAPRIAPRVKGYTRARRMPSKACSAEIRSLILENLELWRRWRPRTQQRLQLDPHAPQIGTSYCAPHSRRSHVGSTSLVQTGFRFREVPQQDRGLRNRVRTVWTQVVRTVSRISRPQRPRRH